MWLAIPFWSMVGHRSRTGAGCSNLVSGWLRLINGSAMSIFDVRIPGLKMTVVQADGNNVTPTPVDELRISVAETYDVIVQPQDDQAYTLFAESLDRTGYACATLAPREGMSGEIPALRPRPCSPWPTWPDMAAWITARWLVWITARWLVWITTRWPAWIPKPSITRRWITTRWPAWIPKPSITEDGSLKMNQAWMAGMDHSSMNPGGAANAEQTPADRVKPNPRSGLHPKAANSGKFLI